LPDDSLAKPQIDCTYDGGLLCPKARHTLIERGASRIDGDQLMAYSIEEMSAEMHRIIAADPGPGGRKEVCALVQKACADADFVARHLPADGPERKILYEDPDYKFCILAHVYHGAKESPPHDHGPTWAIYGQAQGETVMSDWDMVSPASAEESGQVRLRREYTLTPGMAYVYNEGDLHSPRRAGSTRLIRIEGQDVTKIRRYAYHRID
jgi:predicted metal-dependent enzyme (double-stranded beta helix superfamily)